MLLEERPVINHSPNRNGIGIVPTSYHHRDGFSQLLLFLLDPFLRVRADCGGELGEQAFLLGPLGFLHTFHSSPFKGDLTRYKGHDRKDLL